MRSERETTRGRKEGRTTGDSSDKNRQLWMNMKTVSQRYFNGPSWFCRAFFLRYVFLTKGFLDRTMGSGGGSLRSGLFHAFFKQQPRKHVLPCHQSLERERKIKEFHAVR